MKSIKVVAAIIWNPEKSRILISKRPNHLHKGGYWEFPGGKVEAGESDEQALARELREELSVSFSSAEFFQGIHFDYPEKSVDIKFYQVVAVEDEVSANEDQEWRWVILSDLVTYKFPEANKSVLNALVEVF